MNMFYNTLIEVFIANLFIRIVRSGSSDDKEDFIVNRQRIIHVVYWMIGRLG